MMRLSQRAGRTGVRVAATALVIATIPVTGCAGAAIQRDPPIPAAGQSVTPPPSPELRILPIELDDLEDRVNSYVGLTISVTGVVQDILGPRIFTIDEPASTDTEREILVYVPHHRAALVRERDSVTITGVVKAFVRDDLAREWGWPDDKVETDLAWVRRPVLEAVRVARGSAEITVPAGSAAMVPVGTSGTDPVTSISELAFTEPRDAGRAVRLRDAPVRSLSAGGFVIDTAHGGVFVLPAHDVSSPPLRPGDRVAVDGVLLQVPEHMIDSLGAPVAVYVLATRLDRRKPAEWQ